MQQIDKLTDLFLYDHLLLLWKWTERLEEETFCPRFLYDECLMGETDCAYYQ